jgi:NMD protein affecting ribosome stability and mRNA decay
MTARNTGVAVPSVSTVQFCVHCGQRPAGFWVSRSNAAVVRRPWCLACCDELDRAHCDVTPFDGDRPD